MVKEFAFINLFRAIAAFWVLAAHCMIWGGWYGVPLPSAKIAVDLFMMISGYLMAANAIARSHFEPLTTSRNWLRFWLRRFFRLAPAYYLSLAFVVASSSYFLDGYQALQLLNPAQWPAGGPYDPAQIEYSLDNILLHLSFLFGLHPKYSFSTFLPDWSLSLEMQFYFVFPALFLLMNRAGSIKVALLVGIPVFIIGYQINRLLHYPEPSMLLLKLNYFIAGILLFQFLQTGLSRRRRCALAVSAVVLVSLEFKYRSELIVLPVLLLSMMSLGWLEAVNRTPPAISRFVNSRFVRFASDSSYCVYLFHGLFISACGLIIADDPELLALTPPHRVGVMLVFVSAAAYLTAFVVYRLVELPGIQFGKRLTDKVAPRAQARGSADAVDVT